MSITLEYLDKAITMLNLKTTECAWMRYNEEGYFGIQLHAYANRKMQFVEKYDKFLRTNQADKKIIQKLTNRFRQQ